MDPVTHTLLGVGLGNALYRRSAGPAAVPVLALASNLPDLDAIVHVTFDPTAVLMRRTFGHSIFLLPLWCAGLAWLLGRRYRHLRFRTLFGMVLAGAALHLVFDLINSFGVVLFWPLSPARPELAMVFIIDLALTGLLALPLLLAVARRWRPRIVEMSRGALAAVAVYLALCAGSRAMAMGLLEREAGLGRGGPPGVGIGAEVQAPPDFIYVFPEPFGPHRWRGVARWGEQYRLYLVEPLAGRAALRGEVRTHLGDPRVAEARATPLGRRLTAFFKAPVWRVVEPAPGKGPPVSDGEATPRVAAYDLRFRPLTLDRPPVFEFFIPVSLDRRQSLP